MVEDLYKSNPVSYGSSITSNNSPRKFYPKLIGEKITFFLASYFEPKIRSQGYAEVNEDGTLKILVKNCTSWKEFLIINFFKMMAFILLPLNLIEIFIRNPPEVYRKFIEGYRKEKARLDEVKRLEQIKQNSLVATLQSVNSMSGKEFEKFLRELFTKMGYVIKFSSIGRDQGADLVVNKNGEDVVVQAKRHIRKINNHAIQEAVAAVAFYKCQSGMVATNNFFTQAARELADSNGIDLIDGKELERLIKEYGLAN